MASKGKSSIYQLIKNRHFQKTIDGYQCRECHKTVPCGGTKSSNNTSNMKSHFEHNHDTIYKQIDNEIKLRDLKENPKLCFKKRKVEEMLSDLDLDQAADSNSDSSTLIYDVNRSQGSNCNNGQQTLVECIDKTKLWDIDSDNAMKQHMLLGNLLCVACLPFNFVEQETLQHYSSNLSKCYKIPSRRYMTETVIPQMMERVSEKVNKTLATAEFICLTSDIWTAPKCNDAFISFTAHMLTDKFEDYCFIIGCKHFPESHTGVHINEYIGLILKQAGIPKSKISALVTDNASNMKLGVSNSELPHIGCFLHVIQLLLHKAILSRDKVKEWVKLFQYIVKHFKKSPAASQKLKIIQIEADRPTNKLSLDMPIRWNSTFMMIQSCVRLRCDIYRYMVDADKTAPEFKEQTKGLDNEVWEKAKQLVVLLEPFHLITKE